MITIPTGDLTGILGDVIPLAFQDDDLPDLNCVRVEWDGQRVELLATDRFRVGISTWEPGEINEGEEVQDDLFADWGGADEPWSLTVALDDAKELVKVFKLGPKELQTALTVDYDSARHRMTVKRGRDTGHSAITVVADGQDVMFPAVRGMLAKADKVKPLRTVSYSAKLLADFAKVRPRAAMELSFTGSLTHVAIGEKFVGAIMPVGRSITED